MPESDLFFLIPYVFSTALSIALGGYAFSKHKPGSREYGFVAFAQAFWTVGFIFELTSNNLQSKLFWDNVQWIGTLAWPFTLLAFARRYTGRPVSRRRFALLAFPFVVFLFLTFSSRYGALVHIDPRIVPAEPFSVLTYGFGGAVWLVAVYTYALIFTATYFLYEKYLNPGALNRKQVGTVLIGTSIPVAGTFLTLAGVTIGPYRDTTPITFALGNLIIAWGLYRYHIFDLAPVGRENLIDSMTDGMILLDSEDRVIDLNRPAASQLGIRPARVLGQPVELALADWPEAVGQLKRSDAAQFEMALGGADRRYLAVTISMADPTAGADGGRLIVLHEFTSRHLLAHELERRRALLEREIQQRTAELGEISARLEDEVGVRREAEAALKESESRMAQFLDALPMGVMVIGQDTRPQFVNAHAMELLSRGSVELDPKALPDLREAAQLFPAIASSTGEAYTLDEMPVMRALRGETVRAEDLVVEIGGERIPLEMLASPILDRNGDVQYAVTAFRDIRDRKQLEQRLRAVYQLGADLSMMQDEQEIARHTIGSAQEILDFEVAGFALHDPQSEQLIYLYNLGRGAETSVFRLNLGEVEPGSVSARVFRTGASMNVPDVSSEPLYFSRHPDWAAGSELCVPVKVGDRVLGVLNAESSQPNRFTPDDQRLLEVLAEHCGVAVENARLHAQTLHQLREQTALHEAISAISSSLELEVLLAEVARQLAEAVRATSAYICELDPELTRATILSEYFGPDANERERVSDLGTQYDLAREFPSRARQLARAEIGISHVTDAELDPAERDMFAEFGGHTSMQIPMRLGGRTIAYAVMWDSRGPREFTSQEQTVCWGIAQQAASAIENARLYTRAQNELLERNRIEAELERYQEHLEQQVIDRTSELQTSVRETLELNSQLSHEISERKLAEAELSKRVRVLSDLNRITHAVATAVDLDTGLSNIAPTLVSLFGGSSATIGVKEPDGFRVLTAYNGSEASQPSQHSLWPIEPEAPLYDALERGETVFTQQTEADANAGDSAARLIVPLFARGEVVGAILLDNEVGIECFDRDQQGLAETVASELAGFIENSRLFEQEVASRKRLVVLNEAIRGLSSTRLETAAVHQAIYESVMRVMPSHVVTLILLDAEGSPVTTIEGINGKDLLTRSCRPLEIELAAQLEAESALRVADVQEPDLGELLLDGTLDEETRSILAVPLRTSDKRLGVILLQSERTGRFTEEHQRSLEVLSANAAAVLDNLQHQRFARAAAAQRERQRLGRQLHDSVTQSLYSLTLLTNGWAALAEQGLLEDVPQSFRQLEQIGIDSLRHMRLLIHQLRLPELDSVGLVGAIRDRLEAVEHRAGVETDLVAEGDLDDLPKRVEEELYHISQEALNNALHHARATSVAVRVEVENGNASISVHDNGIGFVPGKNGGGLGLISMRERAEELGGSFQVASRPGDGTTVRATVRVRGV